MANAFGGLTFDGSSQYVTVSDHADLNRGTGSFTVECWVKATAAGPVIAKYSGTTGWRVELLADGSAKATVNGGAATAGSGLLDGSWHHLALCADRRRDKISLYAGGTKGTDGSVSGTVSNTADVVIGRSYDGAAYWSGSVGDVRLSRGVRYDRNFTAPASQHQDDGDTLLLLHFNEGKGSTVYDMSAGATDLLSAGTRHDGTIAGGPGTWTWGPVLANPVRMMHEALWAAIDTYSPLTDWSGAFGLKRHRARPQDAATARLTGLGITRADTPGLWISPETVPGITPVTPAYHEVVVPFLIEGALYRKTAFDITDLWWLVFRAIHAKQTTDAGHWFHQQVQRWDNRALQFFNLPEDMERAAVDTLVNRFLWQISFTVRTDFQTAASP